MGTNLDRKVLQPLVVNPARSSQLRKPVLVICITDGEPTGESKDTVRSVITNAKRFLQNGPLGPGSVAFQFAHQIMSYKPKAKKIRPVEATVSIRGDLEVFGNKD